MTHHQSLLIPFMVHNLSTIINHQQPSSIIINHYQPSSIMNGPWISHYIYPIFLTKERLPTSTELQLQLLRPARNTAGTAGSVRCCRQRERRGVTGDDGGGTGHAWECGGDLYIFWYVLEQVGKDVWCVTKLLDFRRSWMVDQEFGEM